MWTQQNFALMVPLVEYNTKYSRI